MGEGEWKEQKGNNAYKSFVNWGGRGVERRRDQDILYTRHRQVHTSSDERYHNAYHYEVYR